MDSQPPLRQVTVDGVVFDWSYQFLTPEAIEAFAAKRLPENFNEQRAALMNGTFVNISENRTVSHVLSRGDQSVLRDGHDARFVRIVKKLRSGNWLGATGKPITDVVNIGVGGSDLGPLMTSFALREFASDIQQHHLNTHFVSSMDGGQLYAVLPIVNPETTVFIIASKSFGTLDTFANVDTVKVWMNEHFKRVGKTEQDWLEHHVIGVSATPKKMTEYGIPPAHQLTFDQSVGGRFSMWSAIGLAIATTCGVEVFRRLQEGARLMDEHFASAPVTENIPMLMALCGVYNREERNINNLAVLPYDGRFRHMPSYLQQLDMESNGKQCTATGEKIDYPTGPLIWGGFGPNGQHAFFQHLHQGYDSFAADFLLVLHRAAKRFLPEVQESLADQQELSVANCLAHRKLMAYGSDDGTARNYYPGNNPNNLIALKELTPESFGAIIAAYEHKVFTQGLIWGLNSFDQPGVELGKKIAEKTLDAIQGRSSESFDPSTDALIQSCQIGVR
ncbi:MAG: glucose-6-phosphate isomerase [Idiomarina sp.]|nr:glucose-6-phosphate isomerase [Idiomarina sp.]